MRFFSDRGVYNNDPDAVLDIGVHDGRWLWACLESGASVVTGVEGRAETAARLVSPLASKFAGRYEMIVGDAFESLDVFMPLKYDIILCLGFFYHILNHELLVAKMARLRPTTIIIDGLMINSDEMTIRMRYEPTDHPLNGLGKGIESLVGIPSRGAVEAMAKINGYSVRYIPWEANKIQNHREIANDYIAGTRFTAVLEPFR